MDRWAGGQEDRWTGGQVRRKMLASAENLDLCIKASQSCRTQTLPPVERCVMLLTCTETAVHGSTCRLFKDNEAFSDGNERAESFN